MTHTPGSWHVGKPHGRKKIIIPVYPATPTLELLVIAQVHTSEANALLIAAAPELVEQLQSAIATVEIWHTEYEPCLTLCVLCLELPRWKAAIAKALGANE